MNALLKKIIITRPYSWVCIIFVAILANILSRGALILDNVLAFDIITALVAWYVATSMVEYFHGKIDGRGLTNPMIPIISSIIFAAILIFRNPVTLIFLPIILFADFIYSMKIRKWLLSRFSFMFRGVLEVSVFLSTMLFNMNYDIIIYTPLILAIFFLTNSRNLIGDIRDVEFDKYIFPKRYGIGASYMFSVALILLSILLLPDILLMLPMVLFIAVVPILKNAYSLHRIFVLSMTFFYANYISIVVGLSLFITNMLFVAVILNLTYPVVPRKSNPRGVRFYSYKD